MQRCESNVSAGKFIGVDGKLMGAELGGGAQDDFSFDKFNSILHSSKTAPEWNSNRFDRNHLQLNN